MDGWNTIVPFWEALVFRCYVSFKEKNGMVERNTPAKTNISPEIDGWKKIISYWNSPFLGDMLVFQGVILQPKKYFN